VSLFCDPEQVGQMLLWFGICVDLCSSVVSLLNLFTELVEFAELAQAAVLH
jgi:hypothetical protein